ncbi:MAG: response regulator [Alphaproteobacteria bacterium]
MDKATLQLLAKCKLIHIEPSPRLTEALEGVLHEDGILDIRHLPSAGRIAEKPPTLDTDVILIDFDHDVADGLDLVHGLRTGQHDADPFMVIVGTQSDTSRELVGEEVRAGLDIILKKPFSAADLIDHIGMLARRPRRFALAKSYIGPDRRDNPRIGTEWETFIAPNRLTLRAGDRLKTDDVSNWLTAWRGMVADLDADRPIMDRLPVPIFL